MHCPDCPRKHEGLSCGAKGPRNAKLVIVGMSPGLDELGQGKPFVGPSGRILARAMLEARIHPDEAYMTNVIRCLPSGGVKETLRFNGVAVVNGKLISDDQMKACHQRLKDELYRLKDARVLVVLGGEALKATTGITTGASKRQNHPLVQADLDGYLGLPCPVPPWVRWILPLYHPAFIRYRGMRGEMAALKVGFQKVKRMLSGTYQTLDFGDLGPELTLEELLHLPEGCVVAFDIENPYGPITQIGFATYHKGQVRSGTWEWNPCVRRVTKEVLERRDLVKVAHNMSHDIKELWKEGIEVADPVFDTMLAHQQLQPEMEKSLDAVSGFLLDIPHWKHLNKSHPELYNRLDAHATALLYPLLREALQDDDMLALFEKTVMPAMRTLIRCTQRGMTVDQHKMDEWRGELKETATQAEKEFDRLSNGCNPRSAPQLKKLLYETCGLPIQANKGVPTTDKGALEKLQRHLKKEVERVRIEEKAKLAATHNLQMLQALRSYRESSKLLGTYANLTDRKVHPSYFPVGKDDDRYGTATGRLSSQDPNIQNQPKSARLMYVPSTEKLVLLEADYSQIELRVAAFRGPDVRLIDMFLRGEDVHSATTRLLNCDRTRAKNVTYGSLYGAGPRKLYDTLVAAGFRTTLAEMRELQDRFWRAYPGLLAWRNRNIEFATDHGYFANVFKRRRYFYDTSRIVPEIVNYEPQSTVADIVLERLPDVEEVFERWDGKLLTTVHDSVLGEVPREHWVHCARELKAILEIPFPQVHPKFYCPADLKVGLRWGRMHRVQV